MSFVNEARSFLKKIINLDDTHFRFPLIESNAASIAIYYLQKALSSQSYVNARRSIFWRAIWIIKEFIFSYINLFLVSNGFKKNCDYLFICNVLRHYDVISPIIKKILEGEKNASIIVLSRIPKNNFKSFFSPQVSFVDWSDLRGIKYFNNLIFKLIKIRKPKMKRTILSNAFFQWYSFNLLKSVRAISLAEISIDLFKPKKIIVTDVSDYESKSFSLIGRDKNIPSICIQYGMLSHLDSEWSFFSQDAVAVFDKEAFSILKSFGIPSNKIFITGNPRFDSYKNDISVRKKTRAQLNLNGKTPLILFISIPSSNNNLGSVESIISESQYTRVLESIYSLDNHENKWKMIIRYHPEENIELHKKFEIEIDNFIINPTFNIYELLNACDLVISLHSTVGLEAIILDKPLLLIDYYNTKIVDYAERGAAYKVDSPIDLNYAIQSLLFEEDQKKKLKINREVYKKDLQLNKMQSTNNCVHLIQTL